MIWIGSSIVIAALGLLFYAVWPRRDISFSIQPRQAGVGDFRQNQLSGSSIERLLRPVWEGLYQRAFRATPEGLSQKFSKKLVIAGLSESWRIEAILVAKFVGAIFLFVFALLFLPIETLTNRLLLSVGVGAIGFVAPDAVINRKAEERQDAIRSSLPETLDQLTVVVEAGLGFDSALRKLVSSSEGPLVDEFARSIRAMRLGLQRGDALEQIGERTEVPEVRQFVAAMRQADTLGVPIAKVLRTQSEHMRKLQKLEAEEAALKLPVKMTFPMVFCMLPALFVIILGPIAIRQLAGG